MKSSLSAVLLFLSSSALLPAIGLSDVPMPPQVRACEEGETVTVAVPFQYADTNGMIRRMEVGSVLVIDQLDQYSGRAIVELAKRRGRAVRPQLDSLGEIVGCTVDYVTVLNTRVCVGQPGYCSATFAPKKLTFLECSIVP